MRIRTVLTPISLLLLACGGGTSTPDTKAPTPATKATAPTQAPTAAAPKATAVKVTSKSVTAAPAGITVDGTVVAGATFTDSTGDNVLLLTQVAEHGGADPDMRSAELYGYQFLNQGGTWKQVWKIQDFVKDCPVDITCAHLADSVTISDIDKDNQAETAFVYRLACRGDVSAPEQKLMMHEGATKYALRGNAGIKPEWGDQKTKYTPDPAFNSAPAGFLDAAMALWMRFGQEQ